MTEEERIFKGMLFASEEAELIEKKLKAHRLSQEYNLLFEEEKRKKEPHPKRFVVGNWRWYIYARTYPLPLWLSHKNRRTLLHEFQFYCARRRHGNDRKLQ